MTPPVRHAVLAVVILVAAAARLAIGPRTVDDAYITWRFGANIAAGRGFVYNPPDRVLGTTTPLLTLLVAGTLAAGTDPARATLAMSIAADAATIAGVAALTAAAGLPAAGLVAGALIAISPAYLTYAVSGMETSLYVSLLVSTLVLLQFARHGAAGVCAGLACLCRPDGALMAVVAAIFISGSSRPPVLASSRPLARFLTGLAAVCLPWIVFSTAYFGSPVPNSILAKAGLGADRWLSVWNLRDYFLTGSNLGLTAAAVPGAVLLWRTGPTACRLWIVWGVLYGCAFTGFNALTHFPWYFVPLLPLYFASASAAISRAALLPLRFVPVPSATAMAAIVLVVLTAGSARLGAHSRYLAGTAEGREKVYAQVARELAQQDPSCMLAATEIGTLGHAYPGPVLDLIGLVSPEAIGRDMGEVLRTSRAKWLVTYDTHFPREVVESDWFAGAFVLRSSVRVSAERRLEVFEHRRMGACS